VSGFEGHFATIYRRFDTIDRRFELIDQRLDTLDQKVSRYFVWLVGIQVSVLLAVIAALVGG
jgi:tetrahydromethanopterin S-methyltransferase subunit G